MTTHQTWSRRLIAAAAAVTLLAFVVGWALADRRGDERDDAVSDKRRTEVVATSALDEVLAECEATDLTSRERAFCARAEKAAEAVENDDITLIPGPRGATGPTGTPGVDGDDGDRGPRGSAGRTGPAGKAGEPGLPGPSGEVGPRGEQGATGAAGAAGQQGPRGEVGPQGPVGPRGDTGDRGPQGEPGRDGVDGAPGPAGPAGPTCPDGYAGRDLDVLTPGDGPLTQPVVVTIFACVPLPPAE